MRPFEERELYFAWPEDGEQLREFVEIVAGWRESGGDTEVKWLMLVGLGVHPIRDIAKQGGNLAERE